MQISTSQFYDRARTGMAALQGRADALMAQNSSGKKLVSPSDDSVAYQRLSGLKTAAADDTAYTANLTTAAASLKQADSTLTSITTQLQRASELAISARNGTQNDASRQVIAAEIDSIGEQIAALVNGKDGRGQYLFGGSDGAPAAVKQPDGSYALATTTASAIPTGEGQSVQTGEAASRVLAVGGGDALKVLAALSTALTGGGDPTAAIGTAIDDLATAGTQVSTVQASLGARAARVDLEQARLTDVATDREAERSGLEDSDYAATFVELQKTMTALSATQASFSKLQGLSLFDYLR
jgi:flagellar hook-associated protein 3 FlgL